MLRALLLKLLLSVYMNFDFFTQPRGPEISISLFPDAAAKGIASAKALPSPLTAAIEGGVAGYKTGLEIQQAQANIELTKARTADEQHQAELRRIEAETAKLNEETNKKVAIQEAQNKLSTAEQKAKDIGIQQQLSYDINADPFTQKSIPTNPDYTDYFRRNPKDFDTVLGQLAQRNAITPDEQAKAYDALNYDAVQKERLAERLQKIKLEQDFNAAMVTDLDKSFKDVKNSPLINSIAGMGYEDVATRIKAYPKGTKTYDTAGNLDASVPDLPTNPNDKNYQVFVDDKLQSNLIDEKTATSLRSLQDAYERVSTKNRFAPVPKEATPAPPFQPNIDVSTLPENLAGNRNIIDQKRLDLKTAEENFPRGVRPKTIEQRIAIKKQAIRDKYQTTVPVPSPTITSPVTSLKKNISYDGESFPVHSETQNRINSDPLFVKEPAIIKGLIAVESGGKRTAKSPTGVKGALQVTQAVAAQYGLNRDIPEENLKAGKLFLTEQLIRFDGNMKLALAAYNAGPGVVMDAVRIAGSTNWEDVKAVLKELLSAKKYKEVENYPDKVLSASTSFLEDSSESDQFFVNTLKENGLLKEI